MLYFMGFMVFMGGALQDGGFQPQNAPMFFKNERFSWAQIWTQAVYGGSGPLKVRPYLRPSAHKAAHENLSFKVS